jgi:hypothetical protein
MADLTDEEKAKLVLVDVESDELADETTKEEETFNEEAQENQEESEEAESETEDESQEESEAEEAQPEAHTFTKQFSNLKGDNWESYGPELEKAYQNSFTEAIRLKKALDDSNRLVEEARQLIASNGQAQPENSEVAQAAPVNPDIAYVKRIRDRDMINAFEEFKKEFPQATEESEFDRFQRASNGVYQTLTETNNGVEPTFPELYQGIAKILGWQPASVTAKKNAAIKNSAVSSSTNSATVPTAKQPKVSDAEVNVYQRMFPNKDRATIVKELAEVKTQ